MREEDGIGVPPTALALPRRGLVVLKNVIQLLREEARFVDEEGDDTNALEELLEALCADGVAGVQPQQAVQCAFCERSMIAGSECLTADRAAACEVRTTGVPGMRTTEDTEAAYQRGKRACYSAGFLAGKDGVKGPDHA